MNTRQKDPKQDVFKHYIIPLDSLKIYYTTCQVRKQRLSINTFVAESQDHCVRA